VTNLEHADGHAHASTSLATELDRHWSGTGGDTRDDALALVLLAHASAAREGHILVVGAGHGQNAIALGTAARAGALGRVFAVDLYPEHDDDSLDSEGWSLDGLLSRVVAAGLPRWVLPHYGTAATFAQLMPADFHCRLVHVEGAHACASIETDLFLLERLLAAGGWLTFGAGFTSFPGANDAVAVFRRQRPDIVDWAWITPGLLAARKHSSSSAVARAEECVAAREPAGIRSSEPESARYRA
jgi:hypothetical protein